jgi:protoheme IX farnesyltransferase
MKVSESTLTKPSIVSWRDYYVLTKPGIIYGNALPAIAGFIFASQSGFSVLRLLAVVIGQSFIIAAGCISNNYQDRTIDAHMQRTKKRALVTGAIPAARALLIAACLLVIGAVTLAVFVNMLTLWIGLVGFVSYVFLYGATKRRGPYGTLVGSIAGATPPVAGYTAVTGRLDLTALSLFMILVTWQMPHFYAIAMRRKDQYAAAGIPVLSIRKSARIVKLRIMAYIVAFGVAGISLGLTKHVGFIYSLVLVSITLLWLYKGARSYGVENTAWAKGMFLFSLVVLSVTCVAIATASLLA